ncbi:hypothetical protein E1091_03450 [Micromonospora fluostatini]|uniref:Uncharacterized protein n=1 Tax=Micromonospora fluostatini TaxID=1629071 RepID=A0ABY2DKX0_9ACTN|nr:hypothetical protein E1091_03450 [Micromonospora fluostatini]
MIDNPEMDDQYAHIHVQGVMSPEDPGARKLLAGTRVSGGGGVYVYGGEHPAVPHIDAPHWRSLAEKLARHVGVTGRARISWEHEGPGRPRGKSREFDL